MVTNLIILHSFNILDGLVPSVLSCSPVVTVLSWLSQQRLPFVAVLPWLSSHVCPFIANFVRLSFYGCPVVFVLTLLYCHGVSCNGSLVKAAS